jgi:heme A synthase
MGTMNKSGQFTDLFLFMIVTLIILFVSGLFIYMGIRVDNQLDESLAGREVGEGVNYTEIKNDTFGDVNIAYSSLYWLSILMIIGMIIAIFIGSYMVTTRPIFFVPYIFIIIIALFVSVGISNAYQEVANTPELVSTFSGFIGSNFIMFNLPVWIVVIGFVGGIIMFIRMKSQEGSQYGYS